MECQQIKSKFMLDKNTCNKLCDDSNGHPSKCNFNCDMECAHAGSSGGGGSSGSYQMVYDNCYSQNCTSSVGCNNLAQVLDCCNSNCNKNPVCMDVCASNNANKGRPVGPVDTSKGRRYFMECAASVSGDDNEHDKAIDCCDSKCGNDGGCKTDCSAEATRYYKPGHPDDPPPVDPSPDGPSPDGPSPINPIIVVKKTDGIFSKVTTPMWWGIGLGIAALVILIISFIISSRRKAVVSQFGFRFY